MAFGMRRKTRRHLQLDRLDRLVGGRAGKMSENTASTRVSNLPLLSKAMMVLAKSGGAVSPAMLRDLGLMIRQACA